VSCNNFLHFKRNVVLIKFCAAEFSLSVHFDVSFCTAAADTAEQRLFSMIRGTLQCSVAVLWYFAQQKHAL
jgi:hypothetical protein